MQKSAPEVEIEKLKKEIVEKGMEEWKRVGGNDERKMKEIEDKIEILERDRRGKNVVVFNLPECESAHSEERYSFDESKCGELFTNGMKMQDLTVEKLIRLGKRQEGKTRPLLVKLSNEEDRKNVVQKAKILRNTIDYIDL